MKFSLRLMLVILTGLLLVGCASVQLVNTDAAKLMPDAVASSLSGFYDKK